MMDNEQPWQLPEQPTIPEIPQMIPQVPDVTLFSPSDNKAPVKTTNFFQRAMANQARNENIPKFQTMATNQTEPNSGNLIFHNVKPSVPDVSLFDPSVAKAANRVVNFPPMSKATSGNVFNGKPSVPDVSILEEQPQPTNKKDDSFQVFGETYKKMLITSHEQFLRQIKQDEPEQKKVVIKKKSGLFHPLPYQDNPLRKYAPKPAPVTKEIDLNSSPIFVGDDSLPADTGTEAKCDEDTFKTVAEMLSEIQKLAPVSGKDVAPHVILRQLASTYLTPQELECYDVESELAQLQEASETPL